MNIDPGDPLEVSAGLFDFLLERSVRRRLRTKWERTEMKTAGKGSCQNQQGVSSFLIIHE